VLDYIPDLSVEAKHLLTEAMNSPEQTVVIVRDQSGISVRVNNIELVKCISLQSAIFWERVVDELVDNGLLHAKKDDKSIFFRVTPDGCRAATIMKEKQASPSVHRINGRTGEVSVIREK